MTIVFPYHLDQMPDLARKMRRLADALDLLAAGGQPTPQNLAAAPTLSTWRTTLKKEPALCGYVSGDPSERDGAYVETDFVYAVDYDGRYALTLTGWYRLAVKEPSMRRGRP